MKKYSPLPLVAVQWLVCALTVWSLEPPPPPGSTAIEPRLIHLRNEPPQEWSSFPEQAEHARLEVRFSAKENPGEVALRLKQQDVKQAWRVVLNDKLLGELIRDEADIVWYLPIAPQALKSGENRLLIEAKAGAKPVSDDIRVGELRIEARPVRDLLNEATFEIELREKASNSLLPGRLTIVNEEGALQATAATSAGQIAARPGVIYTANGRARFGVPSGKYTIFAGRGFEYSLAKAEVTVAAGETVKREMTLQREVATLGLVACDTHIHTFTYSRHGDATTDERMITLAAEGIELPIATDHNTHIDFRPHAERLGVSQYFTPVMGNEVTTAVGHFNVFPIHDGARIPDHRLKEWGLIFDEIFATPGVRVAILNHARDLHSGVRPFGPELFNATIGENFAGWPMRFNAMEIINSGATQTEPLQLVHDWLALLNRGYQVTPVGSSDSHDVSRFIVGQGRTYIRCDDGDVGKVNVDDAVSNFLKGKVSVSYGLLTEMTVDTVHGPGELVAVTGDEIAVDLRVLGPHWTTAEKIQLYSNGQLIREAAIKPPTDRTRSPGVQWQATWKLPRPKHDVHLVAVAIGKGVDGLHWATAKPYQPTSADWQPSTFGATGAVWIDGDGDGKRSSPRDYAARVVTAAGDDLLALVKGLAIYDTATAAQALHLHLSNGKKITAEELDRALTVASPPTTAGMRAAWQAWREQELARAKQ